MEKMEIKWGLFNDICPHCKAKVMTDYEIKPKIRKFILRCPGCNKKIEISKNQNTEEKDEQRKSA